MNTESKPAVKKTWDMSYLAKKYEITTDEASRLCKDAQLVEGKHICSEGLYKVGLMELGKYIKHHPIDGQEPQPDKTGKVIEILEVCGKPANPLKLWVCRKDKHNRIASEKMIVNVHRKIHAGIKLGTQISCEKIAEGLYVHPPFIE